MSYKLSHFNFVYQLGSYVDFFFKFLFLEKWDFLLFYLRVTTIKVCMKEEVQFW